MMIMTTELILEKLSKRVEKNTSKVMKRKVLEKDIFKHLELVEKVIDDCEKVLEILYMLEDLMGEEEYNKNKEAVQNLMSFMKIEKYITEKYLPLRGRYNV